MSWENKLEAPCQGPTSRVFSILGGFRFRFRPNFFVLENRLEGGVLYQNRLEGGIFSKIDAKGEFF